MANHDGTSPKMNNWLGRDIHIGQQQQQQASSCLFFRPEKLLTSYQYNNILNIRGGASSSSSSTNDNDARSIQSKSLSSSLSSSSSSLSFSQALQQARSQAHLLVIYIPSSDPKKKSFHPWIDPGLSSLFHPESDSKTILLAEEEEEQKKSFQIYKYFSWITSQDKSWQSQAIQLLQKYNPSHTMLSQLIKKGQPLLLVVYPSKHKLQPHRILPKIIAQHHCNPPPTPTNLILWLQSLKKRHSKQYKSMKVDIQEQKYLQERISNYHQSIQQDIHREQVELEQQREEERKQKEKEERIQFYQCRRQEMKERFPQEPLLTSSEKDVYTIALRFTDGSQKPSQRRFHSHDTLEHVFNWMDITYEIERERIVLTTMNGSQSWKYSDSMDQLTLKDSGLGKMMALRVTILEPKDEVDEKDEDHDVPMKAKEEESPGEEEYDEEEEDDEED